MLAHVLRVAAMSACVLLFAAGCKARAFWECTDPDPVLRTLMPPEGWLLHESTRGVLESACSRSLDRSYGSLASEVEIVVGIGKQLEQLGFSRVPALADSEFWCARAKRFHQFVRRDLLVRFVVEPLPFKYGDGRVLKGIEGRFGVFVSIRNFDQDRAVDCGPR